MKAIDIIKQLRDLTSISIAKCSKAVNAVYDESLTSTQIIENAMTQLRKDGIKVAADLSTRVAEEGKVCILHENNKVVMVLISCNTDFVTRSEGFLGFARHVAKYLTHNPIDGMHEDQVIAQKRNDLMLQCGENITITEAKVLDVPEGAVVGIYTHNAIRFDIKDVAAEAAAVVLHGSDKELAVGIAQSIVGNSVKPRILSASDMTEEIKKRELDIINDQLSSAADFANLSEEIREKRFKGSFEKRIKEITLLSQEYIFSDSGESIESMLGQNKILSFCYLHGK
jgi:elongation factor Ts